MTRTAYRIEAMKYSEIPVRTGQIIKVGEYEIVLFRLSNGDIRALENRSPHPKGGTLSEGLMSGHYVYCPVYDWKISLIDGRVQAPDRGEVKTYDVEVDRDTVFVLL